MRKDPDVSMTSEQIFDLANEKATEYWKASLEPKK